MNKIEGGGATQTNPTQTMNHTKKHPIIDNEKHLSRFKKRHVVILSVLTLVVIVMALLFYMKSLNRIVKSNTIEEMQEIAVRSKERIEAENDLSWEILKHVYGGLTDEIPSSIDEACERLDFEARTKYCDSIYLVDSNGTTYSNKKEIKENNNSDAVNRILNNEKEFVIKYYADNGDATDYVNPPADAENPESPYDSVIYGMCVTPFIIEDKTIVGLYSIAAWRRLKRR